MQDYAGDVTGLRMVVLVRTVKMEHQELRSSRFRDLRVPGFVRPLASSSSLLYDEEIVARIEFGAVVEEEGMQVFNWAKAWMAEIGGTFGVLKTMWKGHARGVAFLVAASASSAYASGWLRFWPARRDSTSFAASTGKPNSAPAVIVVETRSFM